MFRIESVEWLYAVLAVPVLLQLQRLLYRRHTRQIDKSIAPGLQQQLSKDGSRFVRQAKLALWTTALAGLLAALANPQMGTMRESAELRALDVYLALDVSESMLAEDVLPSRLGRARVAAVQLLEELRLHAKGIQVSLLTFAGQPNIESPLTDDLESIIRLTLGVSTEMASAPGTDISQLLRLIRKINTNETRRKVLVIISDGEEHSKQAVSEAGAVARAGFQIFTLGVGTAQGARIPVEKNEYVTVWKRDLSGREVVTTLKEDLLKSLAETGDGIYAGPQDTKKLANEIIGDVSLTRAGIVTRRYKDFEDLYRWPAGISLLAWLLWLILPNKKWGNRPLLNLFD